MILLFYLRRMSDELLLKDFNLIVWWWVSVLFVVYLMINNGSLLCLVFVEENWDEWREMECFWFDFNFLTELSRGTIIVWLIFVLILFFSFIPTILCYLLFLFLDDNYFLGETLRLFDIYFLFTLLLLEPNIDRYLF